MNSEWKKVVYPDGVIEYFGYKDFGSVYTGANGWSGDRYFDLPDGLTYSPDKMAVAISARSEDSAVVVDANIKRGHNRFAINRNNQYSGAVNSPIIANATIRVFP